MLAIELDKRLYSFLLDKFSNNLNFRIINNDVLKINLDELLINTYPNYKDHNFVMIANLPYSISSKIVLQIIKSEIINKSIIMVQKEMAERISAEKNTSNYNAFSALVSI